MENWADTIVERKQKRSDYKQKELLNNMQNLVSKRCKPCEGGTAPLTAKEINNILPHLQKDWEVVQRKKISREFVLKDFVRAMAFVNQVAKLAEQEDHHPDIHIFYRKVIIELWTHSVGGLSENDFILAAKIDQFLK